MLSSRFIILKSKNIDWWVYLPTIGLFGGPFAGDEFKWHLELAHK